MLLGDGLTASCSCPCIRGGELDVNWMWFVWVCIEYFALCCTLLLSLCYVLLNKALFFYEVVWSVHLWNTLIKVMTYARMHVCLFVIVCLSHFSISPSLLPCRVLLCANWLVNLLLWGNWLIGCVLIAWAGGTWCSKDRVDNKPLILWVLIICKVKTCSIFSINLFVFQALEVEAEVCFHIVGLNLQERFFLWMSS